MNNPENHSPEPSPDEQAERFKRALRELGKARTEFIGKEKPELQFSVEEQEELCRPFEARWAEKSISKLSLPSLGWKIGRAHV